MANIKFDTKDFFNRSAILRKRVEEYTNRAVNRVADEVLRLSQFEVPHDTGALQNSGHVESSGNMEALVGYNKVYAARLHENPQFRFQKGRKGKYLEDPIKNNLDTLRKYIQDFVKDALT
jgi:hypothetical protein